MTCEGCTLSYVLGFIAIVLVTLYMYLKQSLKYWSKRGVPTPEPEFFYGNVRKVIKTESTIGELVQDFYDEFKSKGHKHLGIYFFHKPFYVPLDHELIKNILSKDFHHFMDRGTYVNEKDDPLTGHLFSLEGQKWKNLRQKLTPTFTSGKLKKMFQTLVDCSDELKNCLNESVLKSEPVDIKKCLVQYATDVIGSCAFGIECNSFKNSNTEFIRLGAKAFSPNLTDKIKMFFTFLYPKTSRLFRIRQTNKEVDVFFRSLVRETIEYREQNNITRNDFMQLLIQLRNKGIVEGDETTTEKENDVGKTLTIDEVAAQVFLFFIAGFETSSSTMSFCLYELAKNQTIQDKAREEIVNVLKKYDGKITYDSLMEMQYFERIIQETLRKFSPVMNLSREVTKDYTIPDTDIVLEKGTPLMIPTLGLHYDPEFYPDPEKFDPERFTEENKSSRPDYTYLPFGDGPRVCIGLRFGMMQTKVGICQLLLNYKFQLNPKTRQPMQFDPNIFMCSALDGIWLDAEKITI